MPAFPENPDIIDQHSYSAIQLSKLPHYKCTIKEHRDKTAPYRIVVGSLALGIHNHNIGTTCLYVDYTCCNL
ncbi:hypothetical protein V6N13_092563 [Hibiscus sabdariffa]|uniref:Uncharacterized protein n=2 Tax=Hibiscus sabdariffa TaxID=183260 RepID=A0ABR2NC88_9ROSI